MPVGDFVDNTFKYLRVHFKRFSNYQSHAKYIVNICGLILTHHKNHLWGQVKHCLRGYNLETDYVRGKIKCVCEHCHLKPAFWEPYPQFC